MKNFKEIEPVLRECAVAAIKSPYATKEEKQKLQAAIECGQWEGDIDFLANEILGRRLTAKGNDEIASYEIEKEDGKELIITVTSGRNSGRKFLLTKCRSQWKRGERKFATIEEAAGAFCA